MAHEIRNPLGGIQLYASMLAQDVAGNPQAAQLVQKIAAGVRRLESLVGHVLQFTREMQARPVAMDLADAVNEAMSLARGAIGRKNVDLGAAGPRPMPVSADVVLMGQAILNLVLNAIQATEDGGRVHIEYGPPSDSLPARQFYLAVDDDGPGIPPEVMDRIFNPFFTTKDSGTGLGLAIVHRIVEAHDGSITASNRPAGGARFEIRV